MHHGRFVHAVAVMAVIGSGAVPALAARGADDQGSAVVSQQAGALGDVVAVTLDGWRASVATVSVCGNSARRGSRDCDLIAAEDVKLSPMEPSTVELRLTRPPVGCPCVIRVSDAGEDTVRTVPIALDGVPLEPQPLIDPASARDVLRVSARLLDRGAPWPEAWLPAFAGVARRTLLLTMENRGGETITGIRVNVVVGRSRNRGTPVASRRVAPLAAGEHRAIRIPVELDAPAWGDYVVYGTVSGASASRPFATTTTSDPWALELMLPLLLLAAAQFARRRARARRRAEVRSEPPSAPPMDSFQES
jgi:hypothetical protein